MCINFHRCLIPSSLRYRLPSRECTPSISRTLFIHSLSVELPITLSTCLLRKIINLTYIAYRSPICLHKIFSIRGRIRLYRAALSRYHDLFHFRVETQSTLHNFLLWGCSFACGAASVDVLILFSNKARRIQDLR